MLLCVRMNVHIRVDPKVCVCICWRVISVFYTMNLYRNTVYIYMCVFVKLYALQRTTSRLLMVTCVSAYVFIARVYCT